MPIRIAMDLDNTVFNMAEKYRVVVERYDGKYTPPVSYDISKNGYSVAAVDALHELLNSNVVYQTRVFDERIPGALNELYNNPKYMLFFITERSIENHIATLGQLHRAGIICADNRLIHRTPKIDALMEYKIDLCFDDAPHVVAECIKNNIKVIMISNENTAYNHHLCKHVEHYPDLMTALTQHKMNK